jgi:hypothetical protein
MKNRPLFLVALAIIATTFSVTAQKEYWGYQITSDTSGGMKKFGCIYKTDSLGENFTIVHAFDSINGMYPKGRLFIASNGKLYGMTSRGGKAGGVLFEYDLSVGKYKVLYHLNTLQSPVGDGPSGIFTETSRGQLVTIMEGSGSRSTIFKYNTRTNVLSNIYTFSLLKNGVSSIFQNSFGGLVLAKNGKLYGAALNDELATCSPSPGSLFRIDTNTNAFSSAFKFPCSNSNGGNPSGSMVEWTTGKLYGLASGGSNQSGVVFEYDYTATTNSYTKKHDFAANEGNWDKANALMKASNNKLYGLGSSGGKDVFGYDYGTLYEFDPATNKYAIKHNFGLNGGQVDLPFYTGIYPVGKLLQSTNGKLYGNTYFGVFEYNIAKDTLIVKTTFPYWNNVKIYPGAGLIEICRKPAYEYFVEDTFQINAGEPFQYTVQSSNANTYQWTRNGTNLINQKTKTLNLTGQAGLYSCTMTNQCGTTKTKNLVVIVNTITGQEETELITNCTLSPNPFSNQTTLIFDSEQKNTLIKITDLAGKELKSFLFSGKQLTLEKANLKQGIYLLLIVDENSRVEKKRMVVY